jgi:hypothetical protein
MTVAALEHGEGGYTMRRFTLPILFVVALGLGWPMPLTVLAAPDSPGQSASVTSVLPPDTSTTQHVRDQHGHIVVLRVRALVPEKVKVSDPAQGTVRATVLTIDREINQVKIHTHEGQQLVLYLAPESLASLQVGDQFLLQVGQRALPESS